MLDLGFLRLPKESRSMMAPDIQKTVFLLTKREGARGQYFLITPQKMCFLLWSDCHKRCQTYFQVSKKVQFDGHSHWVYWTERKEL